MKSDPAKCWNSQQSCRNNLAVGDDHNKVGTEFPKQSLNFRVSNFFRLMHRNLCRERRFLHRRKGNFLPASFRPVRLGYYANDFKMSLCEEMFQRGNGKLGSAAENDSHHGPTAAARRAGSPTYHSPCFLSFLIFRLIKSRFSMLRCCKKRIPFT